MKGLTMMAVLATLALSPTTGYAHGSGGGFHGGGGFRGADGDRRGGYGGGWYGFTGYWDNGFYGDPWLWGYPGDDFSDDYPAYPPPATAPQYPDAYAARHASVRHLLAETGYEAIRTSNIIGSPITVFDRADPISFLHQQHSKMAR